MEKRYEGLDEGFYEQSQKSLLERITGSKKAIAGIALTAALLGSTLVGVGLEAGCHQNDPTLYVCPITKLETRLFGYEAGLQHQAQDLEGYSRELKSIEDGITHEVSATDVEYVEGHTEYYAPNGGVLTQDEAGEMVVVQTIPATRTVIVDDEGKESVIYTVPSGYVLSGTVGIKKMSPMAVEVPSSVNFEHNFYEDGELTDSYDTSWTYEEGEFVLNRESKGKTR